MKFKCLDIHLIKGYSSYYKSFCVVKMSKHTWPILDKSPVSCQQMHHTPRYLWPWHCVYRVQCYPPKDPNPSRGRYTSGKKADTTKLKAEALTYQRQFLEKYSLSRSIQDMSDDLKSTLMGALDAYIPSKMTATRYNQSWITRELKQLTRRK